MRFTTDNQEIHDDQLIIEKLRFVPETVLIAATWQRQKNWAVVIW